ncbi:MAG: putative phosphodiesterase [Limisphaerales bacterium]|jgi:predicted phosphodiesterase|tara:strand:+ start:404 stop:577 length:174 start_codon:yes stop_codon:yes gene_type:complete
MSRIAIVSDSHDHNKHVEQIDDNWLLNPGELMGMKGDPTWALYDTDAHTGELKAVTT